ncbi:iron chelate uptake ABC transporter family permease subunit, partial [Vibrio parahaemolyticus]
SLSIGATGLSLGSLPKALQAVFDLDPDAGALRDKVVLIDVRLPRTFLCIYTGAALGVAGVMMQGLFRNPR